MIIKKIYLMVWMLALAFIAQSQPTLIAPLNEATDISHAPTLEWTGSAISYTVEVYECSPNDEPITSLELDNFELTSGPDTISEIYGDLSGLTYNPLTGTFFAPSNGIPMIFELNKNGEHIRTITMSGFEDTEGLVWIGGEDYFVIEERRGRAVKIIIGDGTAVINYPEEYIQLSGTWGNNFGLEGITYDSTTNRLLLIKEKFPTALYAINIPDNFSETLTPEQPFDISENNFQCSDFSGLHYLTAQQNLLILSHETTALIETDLTGQEISRLDIGDSGGGGSLSEGLFQAEGVSIDNEGHIYIVSEPNTFYKFSNPEPAIPFNLSTQVISENVSGSQTHAVESGILSPNTQYCWRVKDDTTNEWSEIWTFTTDSMTTSQQNVIHQNIDFQLFPNPLKDVLTITFQETPPVQDAQFFIYDTKGNQVMTEPLRLSGNSNAVLEIGHLAMGIYILTFEADKQRISKTFLKR